MNHARDRITLDQALAFVKEKQRQGQISLKTLQEGTKYKKGTWSQFLSGKYPGKADEVGEALIDFVMEWKASESLVAVTSFQVIQKMLGLVHRDNELAVFYGASGSGKTVSAKHYARANDGVIYIRCNNAMTPGELLMAVLKEITDPATGYSSLNQRILDIQYQLRRTPRLIILDEADQLSVRTLEMVRTIYDDSNCGLVLLGEPGILQLLQNGRQRRMNLARLYSRVGYKVEIKRPSLSDIEAVINARDYRLSRPLIKTIANDWIRDAGELRTLAKLLDRAEDVVSWNEALSAVNDEAIRGAYNLLIGKA